MPAERGFPRQDEQIAAHQFLAHRRIPLRRSRHGIGDEMLERAARLAPDRLDYQWRLYDLYLNNSQADKALATLKRLAERLPRDRQVQDWYRFYRAAYAFRPGEFSPAVTATTTR